MMEFRPIQTNTLPFREKLTQRFWEILRNVVYGVSPFFARKWRLRWTVLVACLGGGAKEQLRESFSISRTARIDFPWNLEAGELSCVCDGAWIYALDKIKIGKNVCIGEDVRLLTGTHDINSSTFKLVTKPITIGDDVWIATGATVLPGIVIGDGAVVGACSVVTKDVPPWTVVAGNPAKVVKKRDLIRQ